MKSNKVGFLTEIRNKPVICNADTGKSHVRHF